MCGFLATAPILILDVWLGKEYPAAGALRAISLVVIQAPLITVAVLIGLWGVVYTAAMATAVDRQFFGQGGPLWLQALVREKLRRLVPG